MEMPQELKLHWIRDLLAVLCIALAVAIAVHEHDLRIRADEAQKAGDAQLRALSAQQDAANKSRDAQLAALEAQRSMPATPQQIVIDASKLFPGLPQPLVAAPLAAAAPTPHSAGGATAEPAPRATADVSGGVLIPAADLQAMQNFGVTCQENGIKASACALDLAAEQQKVQVVEKQRDAAVAAYKGGTFLQRLGKKAKCIAISGGASAVGAWADKRQPARGAVIGVALGGVGCEIF